MGFVISLTEIAFTSWCVWSLPVIHLTYWHCLAGHCDERILTTGDDSDYPRGIPGCNVRCVVPALNEFSEFSFFSPALAFAQWKVFKRPFRGTRHETFIESIWEHQEVPQDEESVPQRSVDMPDTPTTEKPPRLSLSDNAKEG